MGASRSPSPDPSPPLPPELTGEQIAAISRFPDQNPNPVLRMTRDGRLGYANVASAGVVAAMGGEVGDPIADDWRARIAVAAASGQPFEVRVDSATFEILAVDVPDFQFVNLYGTDVTARKAVARFPDQNPNPVFRLDWDGRDRVFECRQRRPHRRPRLPARRDRRARAVGGDQGRDRRT
ncbi:MAG: hypothetical protein L0227_10040 [Chloroflexi bacterium]|nr:hypothetical protein [Chloroflexota bacterium]